MKKRGLGIHVDAAAAVMALAPPVSGGPATPNFDLQGILRPVTAGPDKGFGVMEFQQPKDADKTPPVDRRRPDWLTAVGATNLAEQLRGLSEFAQLGLRQLRQTSP